LNYEKGKKYPAIIQGYPLEYTDASTAGQVRGSPDKFSSPYHEDMIYNALRGYFVLDDAQMPIIGHPETKNDTFIEQLVSDAKAAVDTLDARGLIDRKRVGIIGHSYGAFMVANLLTHSDLFATGIAKSGAYNRTLTPFGFQGERRPLWKAKDVYLKMSPFLYADEIKKPILLIHGMADNNTGTFTLQSERYFDALKGQGAQARLVLLPEESHGYASIESTEHVLFEIFRWFDLYLKPQTQK
jgi:dipeptidyl aminopeptidase/acylaminoacyl peptidase